ncbi:MAG TPA: glycolate oxidase subunit GlcF, partial [Limnobacter sp.]|uniref:glycolate oxidase subunit GlcF n=1 Tax=Limnobacter sp. TaxID=2003368 RepID=UPI002E35C636
GLLPASVKAKIPAKRYTPAWPTSKHTRKVILLNGCVQPAMMPSIDPATSVVLDALGVQGMIVNESGCCGAVKYHLNDHQGGLEQMKANVDAWWPLIESGEVQALVMNASGCGVTVREYGHYLADHSDYAAKATRISELTMDLGEFVAAQSTEALQQLAPKVKAAIQAEAIPGKIAFHPPCTLQHGQKVKGVVENVLRTLGFELTPVQDSHLCCGSAGTYSVLQPELSAELKKRKLASLMAGNPQAIASANIGCLGHLESGASIEVRHWVEWVAEALGR